MKHKIRMSSHLYLLIAGRELPLLENGDMVADPLEQKCHQLVVLLPAQLQLLQPTQQKKDKWGFNNSRQEGCFFSCISVFDNSHTTLNSIWWQQSRSCVSGVGDVEGGRGRLEREDRQKLISVILSDWVCTVLVAFMRTTTWDQCSPLH